MRRDRHVARFHPDVVYRRIRQTVLQRLPVVAVVERHVEAVLRAGVEQAAARRILAYHVGVIVGRNAGDDLRPGAAEVVGPEQVRGKVLQQRLLDRHVCRPRIRSRRINLADAAEIRHVLGRDVGPGFSAVARQVHEAVVGPGPDDVDVGLAGGEGEDRGINLRAVHVVSNRPAGVLHCLWIVTSEIAADLLPRLSLVGGLPDVLRRGVEDGRIERREDDRERPLPALDHRRRVLAREEARVRVHLAQLSRAPVQPGDEAAVVRAGEEDVDVLRIRRDVAVLVAADRVERLHRPLTAAAGDPVVARHAQRAVVLLRAAEMIGHMLGSDDVIELLGRESLVRPRPLRAGSDVERHRAAAVVAEHEVLRIVGIDPDVVVIAVGAVAHVLERLAAVHRPERAGVEGVDDVLVLVVGEHVRVVERALTDVAPGVHHLPGRAGVVGHQQAAVFVFDQRVDAVRISGPGLRVISVQVSPPSVDLKKPLPGPPLDI